MDLVTSQWTPDDGWSSPLPAFDGERTLVVVFAGADAALCAPGLADVRAAYPGSVVVGCSTAGEILGETVSDDTVTVAVTRFAGARVRAVSTELLDPAESRAKGVALAASLREADPGLRAILALSDGLTVNGSSLVDGLAEGAGDDIVITGGLAGDGDRFGSTWVLADGEPRSGWVTAVGLSGPELTIGHGCAGGWEIFGPERQVTRSVGNVLHEVDGQPALALYKTYLGDRAAGLPATALLFPLAVRGPDETEDERVVRTVLAVDDEHETMTFAGDVPEGSRAQLMRASFDRLVDGAYDAATLAAGTATVTHSGPTLALAVSCVGRRLLLGQRTEDELEATMAGLPDATEVVGFYSYGEIAPGSSGTCGLHNQTMTVTTFSEVAARET